MIARVFPRLLAAAALLASPSAHGHMMITEPPSRSFDRSRWAGWNGNTFDDIDTVPFAYAGGGIQRVIERAKNNTPPDALEEYGGGDLFPLLYTPFAENGNYLEPNSIASRHSICGGPRLGAPEDFKPYSTNSTNFEVLRTYVSGQTIEIHAAVVIYHGGHVEMSICDTSDENLNPGGVPTQECFNQYPLIRDPDDDSSPIDPNYPGRYYVQPRCRSNETDQDHGLYDERMHDIYGAYSMLMKYKLPEGLTCDQCVVQMHYLTGHVCKHIGYDEFEPPSWPGTCAPNKEDWIIQDTIRPDMCGDRELAYPEEFWNCSDIEIVSEDEIEEYTSFVYHGCVGDDMADRIMNRMALPSDLADRMTGQLCMDICQEHHFKYSGTQWANECWCGGDDTEYLKHGESTACSLPCTGDEDETCGGWYSMEVRELVDERGKLGWLNVRGFVPGESRREKKCCCDLCVLFASGSLVEDTRCKMFRQAELFSM
eukprot:g5696.t1